MQATNHLDFILAAYAVAAVLVGGLIAWVTLDYRVQLRDLADLERRGIGRRSGAARGEPPLRRAKGEA
jgi:heme exporter protein D